MSVFCFVFFLLNDFLYVGEGLHVYLKCLLEYRVTQIFMHNIWFACVDDNKILSNECWYSLAFSDQFTVFQLFTSSINCSRCPSTVLGTCDLFCRLGGIFPLVSSMVSKHSTILCLFLAAKDVRARWRCFELGEDVLS